MAAPTRAAAFSGEILPVDLPISATTTTSGSEVAEKSASARRSRGCQRAAVEQRRDAADREQKGDEQWHSQQAVGAREKRGDIDLGPARDEEDRDEETEPDRVELVSERLRFRAASDETHDCAGGERAEQQVEAESVGHHHHAAEQQHAWPHDLGAQSQPSPFRTASTAGANKFGKASTCVRTRRSTAARRSPCCGAALGPRHRRRSKRNLRTDRTSLAWQAPGAPSPPVHASAPALARVRRSRAAGPDRRPRRPAVRVLASLQPEKAAARAGPVWRATKRAHEAVTARFRPSHGRHCRRP